MKRVGIYISPVNPETGPQFMNSDYYQTAYRDLLHRIIKLGAEPILVHSAERTYKGNGVFSEYWTVNFESGEGEFERHEAPITLNFLYDKARFPGTDIRVVNPPLIRDLAGNKYLSYLFAPEHHALTLLARDQQELDVIRLGWSPEDRRVAIKELDSNSGDKVFVGQFDDYDDSLEFPVIVQSFIDTSGGIEGLVEGMHDVRVAMFNGEVIHGYLRRPGEGTLKSNMQYGGQSTALYVDQVPKAIVDIIRSFDERLKHLGDRYYAADFGYNGKEWKLFELNAYPGLATVKTDGEAVNEYMQLLAEKLVECAGKE